MHENVSGIQDLLEAFGWNDKTDIYSISSTFPRNQRTPGSIFKNVTTG